MAKYTKETLLESLIFLAEKLGRKPTKFDLKENGLPNANTFRRYGISLGGDWLKVHLYELKVPNCLECSKNIPFEKVNNKFCNQSCRAKYFNKLNYSKPIQTCLHCGCEFKGDNKYCSRECMFTYQFIERFRDWFEFGRFFDNPAIRNFLSVWKGYFCEHCGISNWNGNYITLEV